MRLFYSIILLLYCCAAYAQDSAQGDLTVSYSIVVKGRKVSSNTGIGETYNGGNKTVFISNGLVRVRQVNLMRMQSIFILPPGNPERSAAIVKESGKEKYKTYLTAAEWKQYNRKYDNASCAFPEGTVVIAGYTCRKAVITLKDGRMITAFYAPQLPAADMAKAEPMFACLPGLVLQYEYKPKKNSSITYTATSVSKQTIDQAILKVPAKGYVVKQAASF